jgi:hypothetical protein
VTVSESEKTAVRRAVRLSCAVVAVSELFSKRALPAVTNEVANSSVATYGAVPDKRVPVSPIVIPLLVIAVPARTAN